MKRRYDIKKIGTQIYILFIKFNIRPSYKKVEISKFVIILEFNNLNKLFFITFAFKILTYIFLLFSTAF